MAHFSNRVSPADSAKVHIRPRHRALAGMARLISSGAFPWRSKDVAIGPVVEVLLFVTQLHGILLGCPFARLLKLAVGDGLLRKLLKSSTAGAVLDGCFHSPNNFRWQ